MSEYGIKPYSKAVVKLLKGVVENNDTVWSDILTYQTEIQDYISLIGLELILKKDEGFAFIKQRTNDDAKTVNLVSRRQYGFELSVMLVVLRQMLEDFDSNPTLSQATDKYVTAFEIKEETEMFLPSTYNYSDYGSVAIHYGVSTAEFFAELAQAFLFDKDGPGPKEKLAAYYHGIVKAGEQG